MPVLSLAAARSAYNSTMRAKSKLQCLMVAICCFTGCAVAGANQTASRIEDTPDLMQSHPQAALPYGGAPYCGPVAASNALIWLARRGHKRLAPTGTFDVETQGRLSLQLAALMKTTRSGGTSPQRLMTGLEKYLAGTGDTKASVKYRGWEEHAPRFSDASQSQLAMVDDALKNDDTAVFLKIGWYRYFPAEDKYVRFGGHWVTVVGVQSIPVGASNAASWIVHDPAPRSGIATSHDLVQVSRIGHGKLVTGYDGMKTTDAADFYKLGGGLKIKQKASCGILDGVVVLTLQ